jgi:hypothetical protein
MGKLRVKGSIPSHLLFPIRGRQCIICERERRLNTFIFCTVVMVVIVCVLQKEILSVPWRRTGSYHHLFSLHPHIPLSLPGPLSLSSPHSLSGDSPVSSPQSNSSEDPFLIFYLLAPGGRYVWRPVLEARNCPRS